MTLEDAIELAGQGDINAMGSLGSYYYEEREYQNAYMWFAKAAEAGSIRAMIPASSLAAMLSIAKRKSSGGDAITDADVHAMEKAIEWDYLAKEAGADSAATDGLYCERALCAYEASKKDGSSVSLEQAIGYLKDAYARPSKNPEIEAYLAMALHSVDALSNDDKQLCFSLLKHCTNYSEEDIPNINIAALEAALGTCYLSGKGCNIDENAAYECFVRAKQKGFDCADMLHNFKKKPFGGYVFRR